MVDPEQAHPFSSSSTLQQPQQPPQLSTRSRTSSGGNKKTKGNKASGVGLRRVPSPNQAKTKDGTTTDVINVTGLPKDHAILAVLRFLESHKQDAHKLKIVAAAPSPLEHETPLSDGPILMAAVEQLLRTRHVRFERHMDEGSFSIKPSAAAVTRSRSDDSSSGTASPILTRTTTTAKTDHLLLSLNRMQAAKRAADRLRHGQPAEEPRSLLMAQQQELVSNVSSTHGGIGGNRSLSPVPPPTMSGRTTSHSSTGNRSLSPVPPLAGRATSHGSTGSAASDARPTMVSFQRSHGIRDMAPEETSQDDAAYEQALQQAMNLSRQQQHEEEERLRRALHIACGETEGGDGQGTAESTTTMETNEQNNTPSLPANNNNTESTTATTTAHEEVAHAVQASDTFDSEQSSELSEELKLALEQSLQEQREEEQELANLLQTAMKESELEQQQEQQLEHDMMEQALLESMVEFQQRRRLSRPRMERVLSKTLSQKSLYYFE